MSDRDAWNYLMYCNHAWSISGPAFKTYARSDQGPENPLRQAYKCHCGAFKVEVVSTEVIRGR